MPNEWAYSWLKFFLANEVFISSKLQLNFKLPLDCLLRLWDAYFAENDGLDLHIYVCIGKIDIL